MQEEPGSILMRRLALVCTALMLVVVTSSAWLRLAPVRAACADWPGCRAAAQAGAPVPASADAAKGTAGVVRVVRAAHRAAASAVLVLVLAMAVLAARPPRRAGVRPLLAWLAALALALAALGVATPGSRSLAVLLGNLLGGLAMLALAWTLRCRLGGAPSLKPALRWAAAGVAGLWLAQAALGAISGAVPAAGAWAPTAHLALALVAGSAAFALAFALVLRHGPRHGPRRNEGRALIVLVLAQVALGMAAANGQAATLLVWLHNATAAVGVALLVALVPGEA